MVVSRSGLAQAKIVHLAKSNFATTKIILCSLHKIQNVNPPPYFLPPLVKCLSRQVPSSSLFYTLSRPWQWCNHRWGVKRVIIIIIYIYYIILKFNSMFEFTHSFLIQNSSWLRRGGSVALTKQIWK